MENGYGPKIDWEQTDYEPHPLTEEGYNASAGALAELTMRAENKNQPPTSHIHGSSTSAESHAWLAKLLPKGTIENVENKFHLGNYVITPARRLGKP
jgi:phosphatidylserine decarboxylase